VPSAVSFKDELRARAGCAGQLLVARHREEKSTAKWLGAQTVENAGAFTIANVDNNY
jgi:hypothetical protein